MEIKGYRLGPLLKKTGSEIMDDNVLGVAAQVAYYFFFSLFPIFLFLAPLLALVGDKQKTFTFLLDQAAQAVPGEAFDLVKNVVAEVVFSPSAPGVVSVGALLALWSGSNVFSALQDALNTAYDVAKDERPWWKKKLIALGCLVGVGGLFVLATGDPPQRRHHRQLGGRPHRARGRDALPLELRAVPARGRHPRGHGLRGVQVPPRRAAAQRARVGRVGGDHGCCGSWPRCCSASTCRTSAATTRPTGRSGR
jgi:hypothetical protein